jgi:hypothetical protein
MLAKKFLSDRILDEISLIKEIFEGLDAPHDFHLVINEDLSIFFLDGNLYLYSDEYALGTKFKEIALPEASRD